MRKEFKGDFLSFSFNNINSSDMGIVRVDDGSRFNQDLLPPSNERSIEIAGRSETFFIAAWYTPRELVVEFAFDNLTEYDLRKLTQWLAAGEVGELFFDDEPDKKYTASLYDAIPLQQILLQPKAVVEITFDCQPFAFSDVISLPIEKGKNEIRYEGTAKTPTKIILRNDSNLSAVNISITVTKRRNK